MKSLPYPAVHSDTTFTHKIYARISHFTHDGQKRVLAKDKERNVKSSYIFLVSFSYAWWP